MEKETPVIDAIKTTILGMPITLQSNMSDFNLHLGASMYFGLVKELDTGNVYTFAGMTVVYKPEYPLNSIVISPKPKEPKKDTFIPLDICII